MSEKYIRRRIVITFTTHETDVDVTDEQLTKSINHTFQDWWEGRYPFEVEMTTKGFGDVIKTSISKAVGERSREELGDKMITSDDGTCQTSAAWIKQGEILSGFYASIGVADIEVETESND